MWNMFKVNKKDVKTTSIVNFEHILHIALVFLLLNLNKQIPAGLVLFHPYMWFPLPSEVIPRQFLAVLKMKIQVCSQTKWEAVYNTGVQTSFGQKKEHSMFFCYLLPSNKRWNYFFLVGSKQVAFKLQCFV